MWTFGHGVREIERSHEQVVVEETATTGAAAVFGALAYFTVIVFRSVTGTILGLFFALFGLYAAVRSCFIADRNRRVLVIKRRIGRWTSERTYKAETIDRIYVRFTIKGSGLAVRFKSGRNKSLTMSLGSATNLEDLAVALYQFLYTPNSR